MKDQFQIETMTVHAGEEFCPTTGALDTPIYMSSAFAAPTADDMAGIFEEKQEGYVYTRYGNPTLRALETKMAVLENAEAGIAAASGMAAVTMAILASVKPGDHIVASGSIYGATYNFINTKLSQMGVEFTFVQCSEIEEYERAIRPTTKLIYFETPSNPVLQILDIPDLVKLAESQNIKTVIDNTFATPALQQPLNLGVDVTVHSATKYLCGHGDAMGGIILGKQDYIQRIYRDVLRDFGGVMSPFNAWLILRGIRTLSLRMKASCANAWDVAKFLSSHPKVRKVNYPGLPSHPGHDLATKQMKAYGAIISFELKKGYEEGKKVMDKVKIFCRAASLGDTRSLILHPPSSSHRAVPHEKRLAIGINDGLMRLSIGIESGKDLIRDLEEALG